MKKIFVFILFATSIIQAQNLKKYGSEGGTQVMYGIWNASYRFGIGTSTPSYPFHLIRNAVNQTANSYSLYAETTGSTFNASIGAYTNYCGYFKANASKLPGGFTFTNVGLMGVATGGDINYGIGTSNSSYTGAGYFYQSANNTTVLLGGPSTENITFGPDNAIRINSTNVGLNGNVGIGTEPGTEAMLKITGGTTSTPPLKIVSGSLMTSPTDGAIEYNGSHYYATIGSTRYQIDQQGFGTIAIVSDADYTVSSSDNAVRYQAALTADRTVTLPAASSFSNREIWVKWNQLGGHQIHVNSTSTIYFDGTTGSTSQPSNVDFLSVLLKSDGTSWYKIN